MRISILILIAIVVQGCLFEQETRTPKQLRSDKSLPIVKRIQYIPDTTAIAFEWLPYSENPQIAGYNIYRAEAKEGSKLKLVASIPNKISSHYVDSGLRPNTEYLYSFTVYTKDGRESRGSKVMKIKTIKPIAPLHYIIPIGNLPNMAKLIWRPHTDPRVVGYVVERNELYNQEWKKVGELHHRLSVEFIDKGLETNKIYRYRVRAKSYDGVLSKPSKVVDIRTKALPKPVQGLTASTNLPKKIKLSWKPNKEPDVVGYRIYRSEENDGDFEFIKEVQGNSYIDRISEDGKQMFYKISAVDNFGLESLLNDVPVMGTTLIKPKPPKIVELKLTKKGVFIRWEPLDPRSLKYVIIKRSGNMWLKGKPQYIRVNRTEYLDKNVQAGISYSYQIESVDRFDIVSLPTEESEITIPKSEP